MGISYPTYQSPEPRAHAEWAQRALRAAAEDLGRERTMDMLRARGLGDMPYEERRRRSEPRANRYAQVVDRYHRMDEQSRRAFLAFAYKPWKEAQASVRALAARGYADLAMDSPQIAIASIVRRFALPDLRRMRDYLGGAWAIEVLLLSDLSAATAWRHWTQHPDADGGSSTPAWADGSALRDLLQRGDASTAEAVAQVTCGSGLLDAILAPVIQAKERKYRSVKRRKQTLLDLMVPDVLLAVRDAAGADGPRFVRGERRGRRKGVAWVLQRQVESWVPEELRGRRRVRHRAVVSVALCGHQADSAQCLACAPRDANAGNPETAGQLPDTVAVAIVARDSDQRPERLDAVSRVTDNVVDALRGAPPFRGASRNRTAQALLERVRSRALVPCSDRPCTAPPDCSAIAKALGTTPSEVSKVWAVLEPALLARIGHDLRALERSFG